MLTFHKPQRCIRAALFCVITHEVCTTETHSRILIGESTATVRKISIGTKTSDSIFHLQRIPWAAA